ncbi:hypothetical protein HUJ04_003061 [Dendroctonus ponderosae]|uniref:Lebercilin domain-containing protein n=2 Tax=Dendroctonus ponderosae TaxID=77166 RepID=A0AAR5Q738_DENPD|nr:hypothetical protein HUJ04_003061 [Dendroctonus ponderosae]
MMSTSCASSVSGHKLSSQSQNDNRSKSCDTNCTSNSSCFFKRRKPMNPLAYSMRPTIHKVNNPVKQRVMSAKLLKLRQLQSQLNDANFHLAEVARENQTLKTLQKRQDKALSKYENTNSDLPRLIHSHEEEIRVLTEKNKHLKKAVKDLMEQLKQKEDELSKAREQLAHLEKLNRDKHLTQREKLTDLMEECKIKLQKSEEQVSTLNRKLLLESKSSKQRLNSEIVKHKQCQKELLHAFDEIDRLSGLLDAKENMVRPRNSRFNRMPMKEPISMTTLKAYQPINRNFSNEKLPSQTPVTEVKLEPITNGTSAKDLENIHRKNQNEFKAPMENIRQRLSAGSGKFNQDTNNAHPQSSDVSTESSDNSPSSFKGRPKSSMKLEKLPCVQEKQRIRTKMKSDNDDTTVEINNERMVPSNGSEEEDEDVKNENIVVWYDRNKQDLSTDCINSVRPKITQQHFGESEKDSSSGNTSDADFRETLQQIEKSDHEEENLLDQSEESRRGSDGSTSASVESEQDIEKMAENLDMAIQKAADNSKEEFDKNLSDYCTDVLSNVKSCSKEIELHKDSLKHSKNDTQTLLETFQNTEKVEAKLKHSFFNLEDDMDFVKEILNEEHKFQMEHKGNKSSREKNGKMEKKSMVNLENKKKLLATLRAIDNDDSVDEKHESVAKDLFGKVHVRN